MTQDTAQEAVMVGAPHPLVVMLLATARAVVPLLLPCLVMEVAMVLGMGMVLVAPVAEVIWMGNGKMLTYKLTNEGNSSGHDSGRCWGWGSGSGNAATLSHFRIGHGRYSGSGDGFGNGDCEISEDSYADGYGDGDGSGGGAGEGGYNGKWEDADL